MESAAGMGEEGDAQGSDSESDAEDQAGGPDPASASGDQDGHLLLMPRVGGSEGSAVTTPAPTAAEETLGSADGAVEEIDLTADLAREVFGGVSNRSNGCHPGVAPDGWITPHP